MPTKKKDHDEESVGQRLARLRKDRGLTQVELAERVGLAQPNISDYERDVLRLHSDLIVKLAEVLKVSTDELLGRKPPSTASVRSRRLIKRVQQIEELPQPHQRALLKTIDTFIKGAQG